jgi:predicted secreted hydrolase
MRRPAAQARGFVASAVVLALAMGPHAVEPVGRARQEAQEGGPDPWRRVTAGYRFAFPDDHRSHPEYKIEWWYYTGNLAARDGRRFGYQVTFFRVGVEFEPATASRWAVRDLFMAHLAVTDVAGRRYRFRERLNRAGPGQAGAAVDRYHVWNEDWSVRLDPEGTHVLTAVERDLGVDLRLSPGKPPVAHGRDGISRKGAEPGNATHYYSLTRMPTRGTVSIDGTEVEVEGLSWMDHEFGTRVLEPDQVGWDWFSIQLDDGTDMMVFQLRRTDGTHDPHSSGTLVDASGAATPLRPDAFDLRPLAQWRSPHSGGNYPVAWRVTVPGRALDLAVRPVVDDQELRLRDSSGVIYWEGAVVVTGTRHGRPVRGHGYLELTGYAGPSMGAILR